MSSGSAKRQKQRKVLLMGKSGAGKSSMRSIVFSNYVAKDVRRLGATIDVEHSNIRFMGNLMLNLWDCGGQDGFTESYLTHQRSHVFASVAVLIFVFDVESREFSADLVNYSSIIRALHENSPGAKIFVLIHKMDLVSTQRRDDIFRERSEHIRSISVDEGFGGDTGGKEVEFWPTSIWDQSLYKAWTRVIYFLVPNAGVIEGLLRQLADVIEAHELILYERTTCLMVTHISRPYESEGNKNHDRFERLSVLLKTHKHSIAKHTGMPAGSANFAELQIKMANCMFLITRLTENTNLAVIMPSGEALFNAARINIALAREKFGELDIPTSKNRVDPQRAMGAPMTSRAMEEHDVETGGSVYG